MKYSGKKTNIILIIGIILIITGYFILSTNFNSFKNENESVIKEKNILEEINRLLNQKKYNLKNPSYEEMLSFIQNNTPSNAKKLINSAKNQGIRCAYGEIIISSGLYMNETIVFEVENQTYFFETNTGYYVTPEINEDYSECVYETLQKNTKPYPNQIFNETIVDILIIW